MNTHADRDRSEVPAGPPLHEPTDRDADNVPTRKGKTCGHHPDLICGCGVFPEVDATEHAAEFLAHVIDMTLRGPEPTESSEVNRFTSAQEATGATPAPLATCWSCGTATGEQHRDDCRYVSTEPTEETP